MVAINTEKIGYKDSQTGNLGPVAMGMLAGVHTYIELPPENPRTVPKVATFLDQIDTISQKALREAHLKGRLQAGFPDRQSKPVHQHLADHFPDQEADKKLFTERVEESTLRPSRDLSGFRAYLATLMPSEVDALNKSERILYRYLMTHDGADLHLSRIQQALGFKSKVGVYKMTDTIPLHIRRKHEQEEARIRFENAHEKDTLALEEAIGNALDDHDFKKYPQDAKIAHYILDMIADGETPYVQSPKGKVGFNVKRISSDTGVARITVSKFLKRVLR